MTDTSRRSMIIETEFRSDTISRRRLASTTSRNVHEILENTKSPTDGLPPTTYTYAHSVSYMPVTESGAYNVPVMARRDLHADFANSSSRNSTVLASPSRFVSNLVTKCFTPHRDPLETPPPSSRRRSSREISKTTTRKFPWRFFLPLLLLVLLYFFPFSICKLFQHYPESKLYQQCRSFENYAKSVATNCSKKIGEDFSQSFRFVTNFRNYFLDKFDDFRQFVNRWFGGVKQTVVGEAKDLCDSGLQKVNHLIDEIKKEREKFLGPKNALKPEQENQLQQLIQHILDEYAADETGRADYALEANGAKVVGTRCTEYTDEPRQNVVKFLGIPIVHMSKQPDIMLKAGRLPGQCFPFKGDQGSVIIKLAVPVKPTEFVLEHLSKSISIVGHINSAPRNFTVIALKDKNDEEGLVLGRFFYDAENGASLQKFSPQLPNVPLVELLEVRVTSNWGNPNYTCLYRFRVHGDLKTVQPAAPAA